MEQRVQGSTHVVIIAAEDRQEWIKALEAYVQEQQRQRDHTTRLRLRREEKRRINIKRLGTNQHP